MKTRGYLLFMAFLFFVLVLSFFFGLFSGPVALSPGAVREALAFVFSGRGDDTPALILFSIRLPRLILAIAVGASLALSGAAFQGFFRNSLADPFVIGASAGAALGAALAMTWGPAPGAFPLVQLSAFTGALGAVFLAFAVSRSAGSPPPAAALLLAGSGIGAFFSALLSLVMVVKDRSLTRVYYWLLGSLGGSSWKGLLPSLPVMAAGCAIIALTARPLDLMIQGDQTAESLGVDVKKTRLFIALGASLASAAAVAQAGIIGFVGLVAPHCVRLVAGPSHRRLFPASALSGAILVLLSDSIARNAMPPMELPLGIITSLAGAPFFLFLLVKYGRKLGNFP
ncbi:MAG: iron ABC transporter permease [Spirochaetaceae bacterium]|jgi:iron complex transport system permease protein|nr:iron ABC transporter permease [Spirochaetaceae bacterium]